MSIRIASPSTENVQQYLEFGIVPSLVYTVEETTIRAEKPRNKQSIPDSDPVDQTTTPSLAIIAQAYFDTAKTTVSYPQFQAVLFCKAREAAQEISSQMNPSLDKLIADSILEEAWACEKASWKAHESTEFAWIFRGASTIAPPAREITDNILDPLHSPEKYTKGSQLWETAAKLVMTAPINNMKLRASGLEDDLVSRLDFSARFFEAAAECTQRACLLSSSQAENARLLLLLEKAIRTLKLLQTHIGPSALFQGRVVEIREWKYRFSPEDPARAEKISNKHLKVANRFAAEARKDKEKESDLLLRETLHTHSAALLAPSLQKKIDLLELAVLLAVALKKKFPTISQHPLFNKAPFTCSEDSQIDWVWAQELATYRAQQKS